jgi:hypothetical protein
LIAASLALAGIRGRLSVRLTHDELLIRYPIGGQRIAKLTSTELSSGGEPGPDSAAYQITHWAQRGPGRA